MTATSGDRARSCRLTVAHNMARPAPGELVVALHDGEAGVDLASFTLDAAQATWVGLGLIKLAEESRDLTNWADVVIEDDA